MITSTSNSRVKWVRSLQSQRSARESENVFVVEGRRLLEEARAAGAQASLVLFTGELEQAEHALVEALLAPGGQSEAVSEHVLKACSATESPQGMLGVISRPALDPGPDQNLILVLDRIADPGNLGTMMRSARAAGVDSLLLLPGSVDIYNPKVVRAAAGAHFHLPARGHPGRLTRCARRGSALDWGCTPRAGVLLRRLGKARRTRHWQRKPRS